MPIMPLNPQYTNSQLQSVVWKWIKGYRKPGINMDEDSDDNDLSIVGKRFSVHNTSNSPDKGSNRRKTDTSNEDKKKNRNDEPYGD